MTSWETIESAVRYGVTGTMKEWPFLHQALRAYGMKVDFEMPGVDVRKICEKLVAKGNPDKIRR